MARHGKKRGKISFSRGQIIFLAALLLTTIITVVLICEYASTANAMLSQQAAAKFRGENEQRFAQATAYFPVGEGTSLSGVYTFRNSIDEPLSEIGVEPTEGGSLWKDAYSATGEISIEGPKGTATAQTLAVGGDWFYFHPLTLRSGTYIYETDLMHDRVVLDETLAWQIFGGVDLAGEEVRIGGEKFIVAGVVSREDDAASQRAYPGGAGLFMHYDTYLAMNSSSSEETSATPAVEIECYELVCAEPLTGYTLSILTEGFGDAVTVQNTGRFSVSSILEVIGDLGDRSMLQTAIVYPYWENAARYTEDTLAVLLIAIILFALFPAGTLIYFIGREVRRGYVYVRDDWFPDFKDKTEDKLTAKARKRYLAREAKRESRGAHLKK